MQSPHRIKVGPYDSTLFASTDVGPLEAPTPAKPEQQDLSNVPADDPTPAAPAQGAIEAPIEVIDVEDDSKSSGAKQQTASKTAGSDAASELPYPGGFGIDVCFEASKLPLDVAIFNCARAAGGDEKIRKYLQAVLVIGGTALIPGMGHALESRSVFSYCGFLLHR